MTCCYDAASSQPNIQNRAAEAPFPDGHYRVSMGDSGRPRPSSGSKPRSNDAAARRRGLLREWCFAGPPLPAAGNGLPILQEFGASPASFATSVMSSVGSNGLGKKTW